ncbi:uncharacterized protein [Branchiostoma lanceolatum]|uniref:uncharacterized protein isoform X1 n=1 Tax=Branchiostoma lanceolatum TaxID=7740 RepID=UPI003452D220
MQSRAVKSEPGGGWGALTQSCPGCMAVNLVSQGATLAGTNTLAPPHLPGCPSQNTTLSQRNDDDDVIFVESPTIDPLQPTGAGNLQGSTMSADEDDLLVTFVSLPETAHYPHARGDCKIHSFKQIGIQKLGKSWGYGKWKSLQSREVDLTTIGPVENNAKYCEKCYCFMCDVPADQCQQWTNPAGAHCNAYKCPSWLAQQTSKPSPLLSRLTVEQMTQEVRDAVRRTDELVKGIQEEYVTFRKGTPCLCTCHQLVAGTSWCEVCKAHHTVEQYDYSLVRQKLLDAVKEAKAQSQVGRGDAGMVMLDSLIHVLVLEKSPPNTRPNRNVGYKVWETKFYQSRNEIMKEIDELLMDIFVLVKTTPALRKAVIVNLTEMLNREGVRHPWALSVRQWEDRLLSLVLTGANLTGRKGNDVLLEHCMVIKRRVERLKQDGNYRQAVRYLKCVNIPAHNLAGLSLSQERAEFAQLQQQVPQLYARCGAFNEAFMALASGPVDAKHICDSVIAKMDGAAFLELMKSLSTNLCGVKGLPAHKILWACLVALTMNVGVQLNLEFLIWFVRWAANNTSGIQSPSHDEAACNRARSLIQASQKGLLTVSALKESEVLSKLVVTASEAVLYPLFAHRHDAYLARVVAAFGTKFWAFECSLNSCTLPSVFASTHLCQWLRKRYLPTYGVSRLRDTTWSNILMSAPQPVAAVLIEDMLNITPVDSPTIFGCLRFYTSNLVSVPSARVNNRLLAVFANQVFPMAKAADKTTLLSNIVKLSFFNDPNEASVAALRDLYAKEWPKVLDGMIRLLPQEKMEAALVSCFSTCVKKGEVDIVVRMLHANRAGHASTKTAYDYVPTVSVLVEKLAGQLLEIDKDTAMQMCDSIKDWLRDESYSPLLCQNCNYDIPLISLNQIWKSVGSLCPDRLEHILAHAMKKLGKALTSFHMVKQAQRVSIVSWLKRVAAVLKQAGKNLEYQVHLSFLVSAISTKRGLVKEIQNCPELAADIIPGWMLQEWEGKYVRSMSEWSVQSSGPTKLTFKKTISPGPVSPVATSVSSPGEQGPASHLSQLSNAPAAVFKAGVDNIMSMQPSLKESNNNVRAPGNGVKDMKSMSLEEILQYNCPIQPKSMVNGEASHPDTSNGGSPGSLQVSNQTADARYAQQDTLAVNGMVQHYNPVSNCASQALHMVASRMQMANISSQPSLLESQQMATTSAVPPLTGSNQRPISGIETIGNSTILSSAGSRQAILRFPPPLVSDSGNHPQADQVPLVPPHSRLPPPQYESYLRSLQNTDTTATQPLPPQSSGSQNMTNSGRPLDRMVNFVNSLGTSSTAGQTMPHMNPYQLTQPFRYSLDLQQLSTGQILSGIPQHPNMHPSGGSSSAAVNVSQSQPVQPGGQVAPQQCSTTAVLGVRPTIQQYGGQQQLQNIQSQIAPAARTSTPELAPVQLQPASSSAVGLSTTLFPNAAMGVSMPVSIAQIPRFPTTSEPVHVFIPNVHQNLVNGGVVPMSVVHHRPSPQPFVVSSETLQAVHPVSVSSSLHSIAGQGAQGLALSSGGTLGTVGQQTGGHVDNALNADILNQQMQAAVSAQDKGPVPVHVTFVPAPCRQEEETQSAESEDEYTFDTTMPSPPRDLEIDEIVLISDSEEGEEETSNSKPDDNSSNKEDQGQDDLPEKDSSSAEQISSTENLETDTQPEDAQQNSDVEPLLNMSCESIESDVDESRTVPQPAKRDVRENVVKTSLNVQENTPLSDSTDQSDANFSGSPERNGVGLEVQNALSSEGTHQANGNCNESNVIHDHIGAECAQDEKESNVLENTAATEPDPENANFMESNKSREENGVEHTQGDTEAAVLEDVAPTKPDQSEIEPAGGSSVVANSDITAVVDDVSNDTNDKSDDKCLEQASCDKENESQIEDENSSIQNQCTTQDNDLASVVCLANTADIQCGNYNDQQTDNDESSSVEKPYSASDQSQLDMPMIVNSTEQHPPNGKEQPSKETDSEISTAVACVVAGLVIDVVKAAEKSSSSTKTTSSGSDAQPSRPSSEDIGNNAQTSSSNEKATNKKDSRPDKKRKAEAHVNDAVKRTKKMSESDSKAATGIGTKRTSGNAKENRKVALEKIPKEVRPNKVNKAEQRTKLTRANSEQISIRATDGKNGKVLNSAGKTVDTLRKRPGKVRVEESHPRSARKDREGIRKDGLVSLEIMTVDASAQASVTVQELQTVRCNVSFEQRKSNKTAKEKLSCRSLGPRGKMLRSSSCDDTAKERNALHRWLGRPTKGKSSGPLKTALRGKKQDTYQNVLAKKRILDRSKIPHGVKLPRGLKLKKFPIVILERIDTGRHPRKQRCTRSRSQPT